MLRRLAHGTLKIPPFPFHLQQPYLQNFTRPFAAVPSYNDARMGSEPVSQDAPTVRVFIAGGSYAGLSVAANLLDLGQGLAPRMFQQPYEHHPKLPRVSWDITIADERDGFCKS
jgi:hypothetical protein